MLVAVGRHCSVFLAPWQPRGSSATTLKPSGCRCTRRRSFASSLRLAHASGARTARSRMALRSCASSQTTPRPGSVPTSWSLAGVHRAGTASLPMASASFAPGPPPKSAGLRDEARKRPKPRNRRQRRRRRWCKLWKHCESGSCTMSVQP